MSPNVLLPETVASNLMHELKKWIAARQDGEDIALLSHLLLHLHVKNGSPPNFINECGSCELIYRRLPHQVSLHIRILQKEFCKYEERASSSIM